MEFKQNVSRSSRISMPMCQRTVNTDISEDITIPDYYPEIRRVMYVKEYLPTPAAFVGGGRVEISGVADYTLIYLDGEGRICSAPIASEYSFSLPLENVSDFELSEGVSVMSHSTAESASVRLSGPRRLQLRSHVNTSVAAWGVQECMASEEGEADTDCVQRLVRECTCADVICESSDLITLEDEYKLADGCRIALADAKTVIRRAYVDGDSIRTEGELLVKMLVSCDGEAHMERITRRIKLDAQTELDGIVLESDDPIRVSGEVNELNIGEADEQGMVSIKADLTLRVCAVAERTAEYVADLYSTKQSVELSMKKRNVPILIANGQCRISANDILTRDEAGIPEDTEIIDVCGRAIVNKVESSEEACTLVGECRYSVIYKADGETACAELKIPLRYAMEGTEAAECFEVIGDVMESDVMINGGDIIIDSQILLSYTLFGSREVEMLEKAKLGEELSHSGGEWIICYTTENDSLWSIAKRYCVASDAIRGEIGEGGFVMIERG